MEKINIVSVSIYQKHGQKTPTGSFSGRRENVPSLHSSELMQTISLMSVQTTSGMAGTRLTAPSLGEPLRHWRPRTSFRCIFTRFEKRLNNMKIALLLAIL